ncbi:MAG: hypothetical protein WEF50_13280 [Myxococcota bacterium]
MEITASRSEGADIPVEDLERGRLLIGISVPDERVDHALAALARARADRLTVP